MSHVSGERGRVKYSSPVTIGDVIGMGNSITKKGKKATKTIKKPPKKSKKLTKKVKFDTHGTALGLMAIVAAQKIIHAYPDYTINSMHLPYVVSWSDRENWRKISLTRLKRYEKALWSVLDDAEEED